MRKDKMREAKIKAGNYCAYQERTQQEVRDKLYALGLYRDEVEEVLSELITENFVNELRFAVSFAGGKFRLKKWGKRKIEYALQQKKISPYCIRKALGEISDEMYLQTLHQLMDQKRQSLKGNDFEVKNKLGNFLIRKGFESEIVWRVVREITDQD